jgi:hypothetical protein
MQARVGQLLQQGWDVALIICRMQLFVLAPHNTDKWQGESEASNAFTTARKQSAAREMADTNPSTIRRVMEQLVFSFLLPHRDAAMIARDSSNSTITAGSSAAREGRTLANGVHGRGWARAGYLLLSNPVRWPKFEPSNVQTFQTPNTKIDYLS